MYTWKCAPAQVRARARTPRLERDAGREARASWRLRERPRFGGHVNQVLEHPAVDVLIRRSLLALGNGSQRQQSAGKADLAELATLAEWRHHAGTHAPILIVDDESDIRESLRGLLEDEGYAVAEAADGVGGLDYLRASDEPHVVLLDFKMPRMNGAELLQAIMSDARLAGRDAFVLITANLPLFPPELTALLAQLAIPVVTKPFDLARLLLAVEAAELRLRSS